MIFDEARNANEHSVILAEDKGSLLRVILAAVVFRLPVLLFVELSDDIKNKSVHAQIVVLNGHLADRAIMVKRIFGTLFAQCVPASK